ncbi:MAG: Rho termination factor N-terminal domain-containing protein [Methyloligellaceae bacterium]
MDYTALSHMTVNKLREEAKKLDLKGVTGMKKEELIKLLAEKLGIEIPKKHPKIHKKSPVALSKNDLKAKIVELKALRDKARADNKSKQVDLLRRRIHLLKRRIRRIA